MSTSSRTPNPDLDFDPDLVPSPSLVALRNCLLDAYANEVRSWTSYLRRHGLDNIQLVVIGAERGGRRRFEVREARQGVLPLSKAPREHLADWLGLPAVPVGPVGS